MDLTSASQMFLLGLEQVAKNFGKQAEHEQPDTREIIDALKQKEAEHEERSRRISETIANGARLSRRRAL